MTGLRRCWKTDVQQESTATDGLALLSALQFADSFFPGGGVALSWGLEQLRSDRELASAEDLASFVEGQLVQRWAAFDAPALSAAWHAAGDLERLRQIDALVEAMTLAQELRDGSRRAGAALLNVHSRLGGSAAGRFRALALAGETPGHLAVAQGLAWRDNGVPEPACRAMSAHLLATGLVSAALRLGVVGHLQAQAALNQVRPVTARLLDQPVAPLENLAAFTPATDIAAMRHESADSRMFSN